MKERETRGKLTRVTLEFENETHILEKNVQEWLGEVNSLIAIHCIRNNDNPLEKYHNDWQIHKFDENGRYIKEKENEQN